MAMRNQKYLDWVKTNRKCLVSGKKAEVAHHVRFNDNTSGVGLRPSDYRVLPLLHAYHTTGSDAVHRIGPKSFYQKFSVDPKKVMILQMIDYLFEIYNYKYVSDEALEQELLPYLESKIESLRPVEEIEKELLKEKVKKEKLREKRKELKKGDHHQKLVSQQKEKEKELYQLKKERLKESQKEFQREYKLKMKEQLEEQKKLQREFRKAKYQEMKKIKKEWENSLRN